MEHTLYYDTPKTNGKKTGGLVTTYVRIYKLLKEEYNIKILSIFNYEENELFNNTKCCRELTNLKKTLVWLKEPDKFALQNAIRDLDNAYQNFLKE